ncbi:MAG TPA: hypothetical protein VES20_16000 [Bryobacteraceae bacterium]|nr:hypothetical protein [Bryobacteraceae bacterium]
MPFRKSIPAVCLSITLIVAAFAEAPVRDGRFLFEQETFGGNGRACQTCHSPETGTVSPIDAQRRFAMNRLDPLFRHDGTDDGQGQGVQRMLTEATVVVEIPLPSNVRLADDVSARTVKVRRGIPSTLNTPALDTVLMQDGREPNLQSQALNAIRGHAQAPGPVSTADLEAIARFQVSDRFFSSPALREFARGGPGPQLPVGVTDSEKRGRRFFEDRVDPKDLKVGSCSVCHSGPLLNQPNQFFPVPGLRMVSVNVSEFNQARNPVRPFVFRNADGSETTIMSPDPGRALITGRVQDANAFKITPLRGIRRTAPYFHDNSARTLEDVAAHYARLFAIFDPRNPVILTAQDQADMVAYMKLLD